jgi:type II secretory pathway pseudopilin PulG
LVELLVVITIIGILIALLLPAVQAAREAARRMQCSNNLKQIALALHNYEVAKQQLPAGLISRYPYPDYPSNYDPWAEASNKTPGFQGTSWMLAILPYMEQNNLYDRWDFTQNINNKANNPNPAIASQDIPGFYCPSRRSGVSPDQIAIMFPATLTGNNGSSVGGWTSGGTDYGGCLGRQDAFDNQFRGSSGGASTVSHLLCAGKYIFYADPDNGDTSPSKRGVFVPNFGTTLAEIRDGLSNTIMIGEMQRLLPPGTCPVGQNA